jgi:hypothetical protein
LKNGESSHIHSIAKDILGDSRMIWVMQKLLYCY